MNQIALISGANRGLGMETARRLARSGATVIIGGRDARAGEAAAQEIRDDGLIAESVLLDVTSKASVDAAAREITARHGILDIPRKQRRHPSGGHPPRAVGRLTRSCLSRRLTPTVFGAVRVVEAFLPLLRESQAGRIVNVSSTMGSLSDQTDPRSPFYGMVVPAYQSSKAALNGITIALSKPRSTGRRRWEA